MSAIENITNKFLDENRKIIKPDRRIIVFLFFVFISSLFWFLNQLESEYETDISYPVRFENFPKNKIVAGELPNFFTIRVKARGYKILEHKVSNTFLPYVINVSNLTLRFYSGGSTSKFFTLTRFLEDNIENQISSDFQVIKILPDTLFFEFTDLVFKKVPVISQINSKPAAQFMIKGNTVINPDSIVISGARPIIDSINAVFTEKRDAELDKNFNKDLDLLEINSVDFSKRKVNISIMVEKFTEGSQRVDIKIINIPDSLVLRVFPNEATVNYHVGLTDYEKIIPQLFEVVADYNDVKLQSEKLNLKLINYPDYLQSVRFFPTSVEYIIEKK